MQQLAAKYDSQYELEPEWWEYLDAEAYWNRRIEKELELNRLKHLHEEELRMRENFRLKSDGTVRAWGSGAVGQIGDGSSPNEPVAIKVKFK